MGDRGWWDHEMRKLRDLKAEAAEAVRVNRLDCPARSAALERLSLLDAEHERLCKIRRAGGVGRLATFAPLDDVMLTADARQAPMFAPGAAERAAGETAQERAARAHDALGIPFDDLRGGDESEDA